MAKIKIKVEKRESWVVLSGPLNGVLMDDIESERHLKLRLSSELFLTKMIKDLERQRVNNNEIAEFKRMYIKLGGRTGIENFLKSTKISNLNIEID